MFMIFIFQDIKTGPMKHWQTQVAPELAITYWKLPVSIYFSKLYRIVNYIHH